MCSQLLVSLTCSPPRCRRRSRLNVTHDGVAAILRLSGGDMRRVLNILQATAMANDTINEAAVYACTGDPLPTDITKIVDALLTATFTDAFNGEAGVSPRCCWRYGLLLMNCVVSYMDVDRSWSHWFLRLRRCLCLVPRSHSRPVRRERLRAG